MNEEKNTEKQSDFAGRTLIIAGGPLEIDFAKKYLADNSFDTVACADSGLDGAIKLGLSVDYIMGDFDSVSDKALDEYQKNKGASFIQYPREKDATDLHLVLEHMLELGATEIVILGATGRRLDHFLANVNILMEPLKKGVPAYIIDAYNRIYLTDHALVIKREKMIGKYISFLPLTQQVEQVVLRGFRYELTGRTLRIGDSLTVSNELGENQSEGLIDMENGVLIVIESRD